MPRYRGDDIPTVADYAHWGEEASAIWALENEYDMRYAGEPLDDDPYDDPEYIDNPDYPYANQTDYVESTMDYDNE